MKTLILIIVTMIFVSCSSSPLQKRKQQNDLINDHLSQEKQYIGGEFDDRFKVSGTDGLYVRSVGLAIYPEGYSYELAKAKAKASAKFNLIGSAPTEFKSMVQQAIGNSLGYSGEFNQIETSVTEVHALQGIEINERDVECRSVSEPTADLSYRRTIECRAIAKVSVNDLKKAYDFTMENKYGFKEKSVVQQILNEQLNNSINNHRGVSNEGRSQMQSLQQSELRENAGEQQTTSVSELRN